MSMPSTEKLPYMEARDLGVKENTANPWPQSIANEHQKHHLRPSTSRLFDAIRGAVKLVLFCAVTVVGLSLILKAVSNLRATWIDPCKHGSHRSGCHSKPSNTNMCATAIHQTNLSMDFSDPTQFSFTQISESPLSDMDASTGSVRTFGNIEVRTMERATGSYIHLDLYLRGSDTQLIKGENLKLEKTDSSLVLKTPQKVPQNMELELPTEVQCLNVVAVLSISPNAKLEDLTINSHTLGVNFKPGLDYAESRIVATTSRFESKSTYSRETTLNVESGSVTGSYPLYDLLSVHTNSGSIDIDVEPKNVSIANPKPATLRLTSNNGSLRAIASTNAVPTRDYETSISTSSGSINAVALHGLRTSLRSINGHVTVDLYPFGYNDSRTDIDAHCTNGGMDLTLHGSLSHPRAPLKKLDGHYYGVSGSLNLNYPAAWQGTVEGTTLSGSIDLNWQGLKIVKDGKDGGSKRKIEALRGQGDGKLFFYDGSGSVSLTGESGGLERQYVQ